MRTFIAVDMSESIKSQVQEYILSLKNLHPNPKQVKWIRSSGIHITLKFLGEISDNEAEAMIKGLESIVEQQNVFSLSVKGTGRFPPQGRFPRVLWAGIEDGGKLVRLQARIEDMASEIGFQKEKRDFHPHLTLGRIKNPSNLDAVLSRLQEDQSKNFGEMKVEKVTFFRSILKPTGAEYSILNESTLK
ncbi:MAG: RNA 2',3'-cyclic phosphodiesterase [Candidatus Aminicenantes bacterium]|nr:RNA 2',3'-cyclic phosphodiesterase [Candidatus Aminicenantes bacterium]